MTSQPSVSRRSVLTYGLSAVAAAGALAACGSSESGSSGGGGKTTIKFWDDNGGPTRTPLWQKIIADFQTANPTITVEYVGIPSSSVQQKYDTAVAGGSVPDVAIVQTGLMANLVAQKALVAVDDRLAASPLNGKLVPGFLASVKDSGGDGKLYGVPHTGNADVLWYRKDLFDAAGLKAPGTYEEFFAAAKKLTVPAKDQFGYTIRGGAGSITQLLANLYASSGVPGFFNAAGACTINDPKHVEFLTRYAALYDNETPKADVNNSFKEMVAQFDGGDIAMMQHNLGSTNDHKKTLGDKAVAAPMPAPAAGAGRTLISGGVGALSVFAAGKNQDAAWKFVEFASSQASDSYWNEQVGQLPANVEVQKEAWVASSLPVQTLLAAVTDPTTTTITSPLYLPQWSSITKTDMEPQFQRVLLGTLSSKEFLDQFAAKVDEAQKKWTSRAK